MNEITDDLLRTVDRLCEQTCSRELREQAEQGIWPAALWDGLDEVGLVKAALPESAGGVGLEFADAMTALRRLAWHAAPVPLAETMLAGRLLVAAGLPVPDGAITVAPGPVSCSLDPVLKLTGSVRRVPWGDQCRHLVVVAERGGASWVTLVTAEGALRSVEKNLAREPRAQLVFEATTVLQAAPLVDAAARLQLEGALYRSVQMAGALDRILGYTLQYANDRVQFGKPIGKFQAVQHMLALLAGHSAAASAAVEAAVEASHDGPDEFTVAVAKARVGEAAGKGAEIAHQVHAAMGFTREHNLHYSSRRLWSWRDEFGNERHWQRWLGERVVTAGGDALWPMLCDLAQRVEAP